MGSYQQILSGGICLAAAFGMGHYLNNKPVEKLAASDHSESNTGFGSAIGFGIGKHESPTSFLESPKTATIVTTREPARSSVPTLKSPSSAASFFNGNPTNPVQENRLPSPGNLSDGSPNNVQGSTNIPNIVNNRRRQEIVVPDFSQLAASFKNTPLELPPMAELLSPRSQAVASPPQKQPQQQQNLASNRIDPVDPYAHRQHEKSWNVDSRQNQNPHGPQPNFVGDVQQTFVAEVAPKNSPSLPTPPDFSAADFAPQLNQASQNQNDPVNHRDSFAVVRQTTAERVFADPPVVPNFSNLERNMKPPATDESRVVSLRAEADSRTRIPFGLTEEAKTELVGLRKPADRQIKVGAKRFEEYVTAEGDTLQSLSTRFYGRPDFYLDIYLSNQNRLRNPAEVPVGIRLQIPIYE